MPAVDSTAAPVAPRGSRMVLIAGIVLVAATWLMAGVSISRGRDDAIADWRQFLAGLSKLVAQHADQTLAAADGVLLRTVDDIQRERPADEAELHALMRRRDQFELILQRQRSLPQVDVISIVTADGALAGHSRHFPSPQISLADRDYLIAHRNDPALGMYISAPVRNRSTGHWTFYLARKLNDPRGRMIGIALVGIESDYFTRFYRTVNLGGDEPSMTLTRSDGRVLGRNPPNEMLMGTLLVGRAHRLLNMPNADPTAVVSGPRTTDPSDTRMRIIAPTRSTTYPIAVSITATETLVLKNWRESTRVMLVGAFLATIVLSVLTSWIHSLLRRGDRMLRQLDAARLAADVESHAKSRFLANMSHEIRTPMNGMLGMTELLLRTPLEPRQRELADTAYASGKVLLHLIDDILDISKIEAGKMELECVDFDLRALVLDEMNLFRAAALQKGIGLTHAIDADVPSALRGDALRLRQILTNLLGNAVKFTEAGGVSLSVDAVPGGEPGQALEFVVRDSGIGIEPAAVDRLFEPFTQADSSTTRRFGGTGLGLAITGQLVDMMAGRIEVRSDPGHGSEFRVSLTLERCLAPAVRLEPRPAVALAAARAGELVGLQMLLVEDNAVNAEVGRAMLRSLGVEATVATSGAAAVALAISQRYAAVLMDCQMPEMDGFEATRRIRAQGRADLPIIALTANAMAGDRERCLAAGMNDYLTKPYTREALEQVLVRSLSSSLSSAADRTAA